MYFFLYIKAQWCTAQIVNFFNITKFVYRSFECLQYSSALNAHSIMQTLTMDNAGI